MFLIEKMSIILLVIIYLNFVATEAEKTDTCGTTASSQIWTIQADNAIHYYLQCEKALVTYNKANNFVVIIHGDTNTISTYNAKTGFGGILNYATNLGTLKLQDFKPFNMAGLANGNYENILDIYKYASELIPKVTGDNELNVELVNATTVMADGALTSDFSKWNSFRGYKPLVKNFQANFQPLWNTLHELLATKIMPIDQASLAFLLYGFDVLGKPANYFSNFQGELALNKVIQEFKNLITTSNTKGQFKRVIKTVKSLVV